MTRDHVINVDELPGGENGTPHKFVSRSATHRQVSIHPVARMETEWLE